MTVETHTSRALPAFLTRLTRTPATVRDALRTEGATDDVARRLPGYPTSHRGAFAVSLLADRRPAL